MKKLLRGTQAIKQKAGVVQGTHDDIYNQLDKEIQGLHKIAKELPKVIDALRDRLKSLWKAHAKITTEMSKITESLDLSPLYLEMCKRLESVVAELEVPRLEKLQDDLTSSAIEVLHKLDTDIKNLDKVRDERKKRRLEYDALREKAEKKEAELVKKGKDAQSDPSFKARKIDEESAGKAYEFANERSIEEMTKVACVKDDVLGMTVYNVACFLGEYYRTAGDMFLGVKQIYEAGHGSSGNAGHNAAAPATESNGASTPSSPSSCGGDGRADTAKHADPVSPANKLPSFTAKVPSPVAAAPPSPKTSSPVQQKKFALGTAPPPLDQRAASPSGGTSACPTKQVSGVAGYASCTASLIAEADRRAPESQAGSQPHNPVVHPTPTAPCLPNPDAQPCQPESALPSAEGAVHPPSAEGAVHPPSAEGAVHPPSAEGAVHPPSAEGVVHPPSAEGEVDKPSAGSTQ